MDGICYFAIVENHVGLIEGNKTRARTLERYLTRIFQEAGEFEPGHFLTLNARIEGLKAQEVSEISISAKRSPSLQGENVSGGSDSYAGQEEGQGETVIDVLKAFGWSDDDIMGLRESVPEGGWLEGIWRMKIRGKGRKAATVERTHLEEALRNLPPSSIGLMEPGVGTEKGGVYKLSAPTEIARNGDLLDPEEAMKAIVRMLKMWAKGGRIDLEF